MDRENVGGVLARDRTVNRQYKVKCKLIQLGGMYVLTV